MKTEKISGGSARLAQVMLLLFCMPYIFFLSYLTITQDITLSGIAFLLAFIFVITLVLIKVFSYADIYLSNDLLVIKKIFSAKSKYITEIKEVDKSLVPFTYYIKFEDKLKVFFFSNTSDLFKQLVSFDPDKGLKIIRTKLSKDNIS